MEVKDKIKELRKARGWSQTELAEKIGAKTPASVSQLEKGTNVRPSTIARLAAAFDMSVPEFLAGTDQAPAASSIPAAPPNLETDPAAEIGRAFASVLDEVLTRDQLHMIAAVIRMDPDKAPDVRRVLDAVLVGIGE